MPVVVDHLEVQPAEPPPAQRPDAPAQAPQKPVAEEVERVLRVRSERAARLEAS